MPLQTQVKSAQIHTHMQMSCKCACCIEQFVHFSQTHTHAPEIIITNKYNMHVKRQEIMCKSKARGIPASWQRCCSRG